MVGVELPEDGEDAFVGEEHLPYGLDPPNTLVGGDGVGAELFLEHSLPGVELEDGEHGVFVGVEEHLLRVFQPISCRNICSVASPACCAVSRR